MAPLNLAEGPLPRPEGSNADEWAAFLADYDCPPDNRAFIAVSIAEAIEAAERRGALRD
jgi:hypothetical protein